LNLTGDARWSWHPNQLRHTAATFIAEHEALDVARVILGHSDVSTTIRYAQVPARRAAAAALKLG
jgi:site-specific recombinase XerD